MIIPSLLNGKNKADLAPITTFILPFNNPLQIIFFLFFVIPECHSAGSKPKYSLNFFSNSLVNPISGNKISPWYPLSIFSFIDSKYTIVFPEPVIPWSRCTLKFLLFLFNSFRADFCSYESSNFSGLFLILYLSYSMHFCFSMASLLKRCNFNAMPFGIKLYSENQFKNLIVLIFNGLISIFSIIFLILNSLELFFSKWSQTTPVILIFPNGTKT